MVLHSCWNCNAHQIERARELRAVISDAGGTPAFPVGPLLVDDRIPMVERVEPLRETEGVFRQNGELQRPYDLLDDVVEPRRFEDDRPQVVTIVVGLALARSDDLVRGNFVERTDNLVLRQPIPLPQLV